LHLLDHPAIFFTNDDIGAPPDDRAHPVDLALEPHENLGLDPRSVPRQPVPRMDRLPQLDAEASKARRHAEPALRVHALSDAHLEGAGLRIEAHATTLPDGTMPSAPISEPSEAQEELGASGTDRQGRGGALLPGGAVDHEPRAGEEHPVPVSTTGGDERVVGHDGAPGYAFV